MGGSVPKQFLPVGDAPLLVHALRALLACPLVDSLVLVVPEAERARTEGLVEEFGLPRIIGPVPGGATRQESVRLGLAHLPSEAAVVAVHDAARPFPDPDTLARAIRRAAEGVGVVVGRPVRDTIKEADRAGRVIATPDRTRLWQAFTPQVFPVKMIVSAYAAAHRTGEAGTDDASLVERMGAPVEMLEGGREALKVTTPDDLAIARAWLNLDR